MSRFTSDRERRLWLWAVAVVGAIYSTLGLAGKLAEVLRDRGLLDISFFVSFIVVDPGNRRGQVVSLLETR